MKSTTLALAAILSVTSAAWATPATLTHTQLLEIVQNASAMYPYFVAADNVHGLAFICQVGFEDFAGGPVTATVIRYEPGEDGRDYVKLDACNQLER